MDGDGVKLNTGVHDGRVILEPSGDIADFLFPDTLIDDQGDGWLHRLDGFAGGEIVRAVLDGFVLQVRDFASEGFDGAFVVFVGDAPDGVAEGDVVVVERE